MKKALPYLALLLLVLLPCCSKKGRIIPEDKLVDIYADMFLADQWINSQSRLRRTADTTCFYEPILREYGYTTLDYDATVRHYVRKPDDYSKILKMAGQKLQAQSRRLQKVEDAYNKREKLPPYKKRPLHFGKIFDSDTFMLWHLADTALLRIADSTALAPVDSLALRGSLALADSTALAALDSLALADSLVQKSASADSLVQASDSLKAGSLSSDSPVRQRRPLIRHGQVSDSLIKELRPFNKNKSIKTDK